MVICSKSRKNRFKEEIIKEKPMIINEMRKDKRITPIIHLKEKGYIL